MGRSSIKHLLIATFPLLHLHMITGDYVRHAVTCRHAPKSTTIRCGDDELIYVWNTTSAAVSGWTDCNVQDVVNAIAESPAMCKQFEPRSFARCDGERWCEVAEDMAEQAFVRYVCEASPGNVLSVTNILQVSYSCVKVTGSDFAFLPIRHKITGADLHILSPYYPCHMPEGKYSLKCRIESSRPEGGAIQIRIRLLKLMFGARMNCEESLTFTKDTPSEPGNVKRFCNANVIMHQMHFKPLLDSLHMFWNITYRKVSSGIGGKFKMTIESLDGIDITLSCDDDRIPASHQLTKNSSTGCIPFKAPELFTTIKTTENESNDIPDSVIIGIVGALAGLLVIASVIVFFIWRKVKKRGKDSKDQNGNLPNGVSQSITTETPGRYQNVQNTAPKETKRRDVYATVDASKKKTLQVNNKTPEDTIMYENEDLYETAEEKRTKCRDDINAENRNRHNNLNLEDETIMHENDDLYSPM